jgi:hypothetical protein
MSNSARTTATTSMNGSAMMTAAVSPVVTRLTIEHVLHGCHIWSNGTTTATMMRLHLKVGQRLAILDQDVDPHQMMQFSGPARLHLGGPMMPLMTKHALMISFPSKGVYRLGTRTVHMPAGMPSMDVKTIGPDNNLRLLVTVA